MDYVTVLCCSVAFLLYYNTLDAGFVYDDRRAILGNPDVSNANPWTDLLLNDFWGTPLADTGSHGSYRPLCVLTYRLNYLVGGFHPWGYHLVNVLLHCAATALLLKFARKVLPRKTRRVGAAVAGLVFASHPVHAEAVAAIVGRADLAACNLYLLALLAFAGHIDARDNNEATVDRKTVDKKSTCHHNQKVSRWPKKNDNEKTPKNMDKNFQAGWYLFLTVLCAAAAMLNKETGITVLGVCFFYDFLYSSIPLKKKIWKTTIPLLLSTLILLAFRFQTRSPKFSTADNPTAKDPSLVTRFLTFTYLPAFNFWLLLFPYTLSFDWGMEAIPRIKSLIDARNLTTLAFYLSMAALVKSNLSSFAKKHASAKKTQKLWRAMGRCACAVCRHGVAVYHSRACRATNNNNAAVGCRCLDDAAASARGDAAALLALALVTLPFAPATNALFYVGFVVAERLLYVPSAGWSLLLGLVVATVWRRARCRAFIIACFVLMMVAFGAKTISRNRDWHDEEALYRSAIEINPPKAYGNLGSVLSNQGRLEEAEVAFRKALQFRPNMADVHYNLGILLQGSDRLEEAIESYQKAIHFRPTLALAYVNLGAALIAAGRCQEAVSILRQGSKLDGTGLKDRREHETAKVSALLQLGSLYSDQGRLQRALAAYREAVHSLPNHYPPQSVFNVLGETLARLHQDEEAERWYQAALHARPDHVPAHITYGKLLAKNVSRTLEAEQWFRRAQKLAPHDPSVYHHYGEFLASKKRFKEAAVLYERAAELKPYDYELTVAAATAMRQAEKHSEAEKWYRRAVSINPKDGRSYTNLGAILHLNGKYDEAAANYRLALKLQPDDVTTLTNLHKLYSVMT